MDSTLTTKKYSCKRKHRRSAAVSLDWSFTQLLNKTDNLKHMDSSSDATTYNIQEPVKNQEITGHSDTTNTDDSVKKRSKFRMWLWVEAISSLAHLYFGNSDKKKSSIVSGPSTMNKNDIVSSPPSCSMILEPLIDLDSALLTKTNDQNAFGSSKRHLRTRSASTAFPLHLCMSDSSFQKPYYRHGYAFRQKMSVIIEDSDTISTSPLSSSFANERVPESETSEELDKLGKENDTEITTTTDEKITGCNGFKEASINDDQLQNELFDAMFFQDIQVIQKQGNCFPNVQKQSLLEKKSMKQSWRCVIRKFLTRKNT